MDAYFLLAKYIGLPVVAGLLLWYLVGRYRSYRREAESVAPLRKELDAVKKDRDNRAKPAAPINDVIDGL